MLLSACLSLATKVVMVLYVSPQGGDQNPGTLRAPFRTIDRALSEAVTFRERGFEGSVAVQLRGGSYYLQNPLEINANVSGSNGVATEISAYHSEKPVISGGVPLTGWRREGDRFVCKVPGVFPVNQLFIGNKRYDRPRLPETGYFHVADIVPSPDRTTKGDSAMVAEASTFKPNWVNLNRVETVIFHNWEISRLPVASVDAGTNVVHFAGNTQAADWGLVRKGARYLIENVKEALNRPGQFYFDSQTREVSLIPLPGQNPEQAVVPCFEAVVKVEGTTAQPVHDLAIKGITFAHSAWTIPDTGRIFPQAEADLGGAVFVQNARNVSFKDCTITETGGYGLEVADNAQNVSFQDGRIIDLGAGGVKVGLMTKKDDDSTLTKGVHVTNNVIAGGGRVHPAGVGVWIGQSPENLIEGNEIADFTYTGVSLGWSWGYAATNTHDNRVVGNHIHDIGRGVLSDMGGIYHLGVDPGTVISGNRIHDVQSFDYGGWGLYLDEGSTDVTMEDNIVYRCSRESFHQHYGKNNVIRRNILANAGEAQLARTRAEDHLSFTFQNNIVYWKGTPLLWSNWTGTGFASDHNLFWRTDGQPIKFLDQSVEQWQKRGMDQHSLFEDPLFVAPEKDDFRLKPTSPALLLGFKPMDPKGAPWRSRWSLMPPAFPSP